MRYLLPVLVAGALLAAASRAQAQGLAVPGDPSLAWCRAAADVRGPALLIPGFGEAVAKCIVHHRMRDDVARCLIATGVGLAGIAVGGIIEAVAARVIAGRMIAAGTTTCVTLIVGT